MIQELKERIKKLEEDTKMRKYGLEGQTQLIILKEWLRREQEIQKEKDRWQDERSRMAKELFEKGVKSW